MKTPQHLNIDVQQRDIDGGRRQNCARCPIALAVKRRLRARTVYVDFEIIAVTDPVDGPSFRISADIESFMNDFDAGKRVKPFRPVLELA